MAALSQAERRALRAWSRSALFSLSADGAVRRRAPEVDSFIWATDRRPTLEH
jgi:hypothetical protein